MTRTLPLYCETCGKDCDASCEFYRELARDQSDRDGDFASGFRNAIAAEVVVVLAIFTAITFQIDAILPYFHQLAGAIVP